MALTSSPRASGRPESIFFSRGDTFALADVPRRRAIDFRMELNRVVLQDGHAVDFYPRVTDQATAG